MKRQSIALFLSTLALAGGTVACGKQPEAGEGGEQEPKQLTQPSSPSPAASGDSEGGEGAKAARAESPVPPDEQRSSFWGAEPWLPVQPTSKEATLFPV
jgi:hypothetical protein